MNWQDQPATLAQIKALENKAYGFGIELNKITTKGEAAAEFKRLDAAIYNKISFPNIGRGYHSDYDDNDDNWFDESPFQ